MNPQRKNIGKKAENILKLVDFGYRCPHTKIIDPQKNYKKQLKDIFQVPLYIIRPSFINEDEKQESNAGKYISIGTVNSTQLQKIFSQNLDSIAGILGGKKENLGSIIIQEFIQTKYYGVIFSRNPENFLLSGSYEIGNDHTNITSGRKNSTKSKLSFLQKNVLINTARKVERDFGYPQDIEFCIQNNTCILLQTRPISSPENTSPNYIKHSSLSGIYQNINNGEFGTIPFFGASFLSNFLDIIHIGGSIYGKKRGVKKRLQKLQKFTKKYKKYMFIKTLSYIGIRLLFFQGLNKSILQEFFQSYNYSFCPLSASIFPKDISKKSNLKTQLFLITEKYKKSAFQELEYIKQELKKQNSFGDDMLYLKYEEFISPKIPHRKIISQRKLINLYYNYEQKYILLQKGNIINTKNSYNDKKWIYRGKINGTKVTLDTLKKNKKDQVLYIHDLSENISPYLDNISGLIARHGSVYSHNAILLREWKIASYVSIMNEK